MLGNPVTWALHRTGFQLKAMVRDPQKARAVLPPDCELVRGDLRQVEDIRSALAGADGLFLNLSVLPASRPSDFQPEREGIAHLMAELGDSSVQCVGMTSSLVQRYQGMQGFDWWVFDLKLKAAERLKAGPVPSLLFYPSTFMENFDRGAYRRGNMIALAGDSAVPMHFIAGVDYGAQVAQAFQQFSGRSKEYVIQGPEALTADAAAQIFVRHWSGRKLVVRKLPFGLLKLMGNFGRTFNYGRHIVEALNRYPEVWEAEATWQELGPARTTLAEYAQSAGQSGG